MKFHRLLFALILSFLSSTVFAGTHFLEFNPNLYEKIDGKYAMKNQLLVAMHPGFSSPQLIGQFTNVLKSKGVNVLSSEVISSSSAKIKIVKINVTNNQSLKSLRESVQKISNVDWVQPNYIYNINHDPREIASPNDPKLKDQYHHRLMGNLKAWDISIGTNVLIAVTDDGFDINHEDLATRFIAQKGYNFCDNNTDVTPNGYNGEHGTHVSGIAAAELNNGKGGAGVAGNANILPVKFYSGNCRWTSELTYKAYQYATDNGAKIISTSYNIDGFVGDKTFIAGLDYAYDKGVLHFNSAGNNDQKDPPRDKFEELILVASTNNKDLKSYYSNYGKRVQISAPGENILSTTPKNTYTLLSGTSMSTPNAAGSAALIWAAHPSWNRDQVAAQLIGTADNIDNVNPNYKGMLGSGRINNYRALTEQLAPAKIKEVILTTKEETTLLTVHFDKLLNPNVVNQGNHWEVKSLTDFSIIPTTMKHAWFIGTMNLEIQLPKLKPGKYQLTIKDTLQDPFGQAIDGTGQGIAGGNYIYLFEINN